MLSHDVIQLMNLLYVAENSLHSIEFRTGDSSENRLRESIRVTNEDD